MGELKCFSISQILNLYRYFVVYRLRRHENLLAFLLDETPADCVYSIKEVFPKMQLGDVLRGARYREALTQAQLATEVGVKTSHISEMERGKRPLGKEMAKRLAKALPTSYKVFL